LPRLVFVLLPPLLQEELFVVQPARSQMLAWHVTTAGTILPQNDESYDNATC
jgi:hypothetical protein